MTTLTKHEVLLWGMAHIAHTRNLVVEQDEDELFGAVSHYILTLGEPSVPLVADIKMLAEDFGLNDHLDISWEGMEILVTDEWKNTIGQEPYTNPHPFWKRYDTEIGTPID
jgi:hypothetical protein